MKAVEEHLYDQCNGYPKEFTMLRSMLKQLMLKARYDMSGCGQSDVKQTASGILFPLAASLRKPLVVAPMTLKNVSANSSSTTAIKLLCTGESYTPLYHYSACPGR